MKISLSVMCYNVSVNLSAEQLLKTFDLDEIEADDWETYYTVSAFLHPRLPVITSEQPKRITCMNWGLIPHWVSDEKTAGDIWKMTPNAKSETVFEKPAFRSSIGPRRCLVPVNGFYEWQSVSGKKYPYYIFAKDKSPLALAGIYDRWVNTETGEIRSTFSILTTEANPLMERIHNSKKRMPLILPRERQKAWITPQARTLEIQALLQIFPEEFLEAHTVSPLVTKHANVKEAQEPYDYPELGLMLF